MTPARDESFPPQATLWRNVQAHLVDTIKSHAIAVLHETTRGEVLLLNIYLWAEEGAEGTVIGNVLSDDLPSGLADQMARHAADEQRHAGLLRKRLAEVGGGAAQVKVDALSRWKLRALEKVVVASSARFHEGRKVPLFALAYRMEAMGVRVLERHLRVLARMEERRGRPVATRTVLQQIATDERYHVQSCLHALRALLRPSELLSLHGVLRRIDAIERAFGICGALGLVMAGYVFWLSDRLRRKRDRSREPMAAHP